MKKHSLLFALAAIAALAVSCGDNKGLETTDSAILGTWYMMGESYHPVIATFNADGKYEWEYGGITGLKDNGTYTKQGNVITMNIEQMWQKDGERVWHDDGTVEIDGNWQKSDWEGSGSKVRTCTILMIQEPVLIWTQSGDYFFGEDEMVVFMSRKASDMDGIDTGVKASDLQGEYESRNSDGTLVGRLIIEGNNFTTYSLFTDMSFNDGVQTVHNYTTKDTGTFSINAGKITINTKMHYGGFKSEQNPLTYEWTYTYSKFDPATLESEEWLSQNEADWVEEFILFRDGSNLYYGVGAHAYAWKKK